MVTTAASPSRRGPLPLRLATVAAVALLLAFGVLGGLQRAGLAPAPALTAQAALAHAALMIGAWLGSVISIERAVALKTRTARLSPLLSLLAGAALLAGRPQLAAMLLVMAATAFVATHLQLWQRQRAAHVAVLGAAALCWWLGNMAWLLGRDDAAHDGILAAWFAFLVLTIAAERLEMTRLLQRHRAAQPLFLALVGALLLGVAAGLVNARAAAAPFGGLLLALAAWLATQDIARITIRQPGLPRYMAVALWAGYAWLAVGGMAWAGMAAQPGWRDAALHALGLGFVMSMVMAHAPVILPAVAGVKLRFSAAFYAPLALLHLSLAWRLLVDQRLGALLNTAALLLFAFTAIGAIVSWRRRHG